MSGSQARGWWWSPMRIRPPSRRRHRPAMPSPGANRRRVPCAARPSIAGVCPVGFPKQPSASTRRRSGMNTTCSDAAPHHPTRIPRPSRPARRPHGHGVRARARVRRRAVRSAGEGELDRSAGGRRPRSRNEPCLAHPSPVHQGDGTVSAATGGGVQEDRRGPWPCRPTPRSVVAWSSEC
jgi:hypothetical protein